MRDLLLAAIIAAGLIATLRRPWVGVLVLAFLSYLSPQAYTYGFLHTSPIYFVCFGVAFMAWLAAGDKRSPPADWRIPVFYVLWFWYLVTTVDSEVPADAWVKLIEVSKLYLPLWFTLTLVTNRGRLLALLATIGASMGLAAVKGGVFSVAKGFSHRVWGPDGTQYGGNNEFAIATLMIIPLLLLWRHETGSRFVRLALTAAVPLCFASALGSWSRGALLSMCALGAMLIWQSERKWFVVPLVAVAVPLAGGMLPEEWFGRMNTIETYEEDASAMGRIDTWMLGLRYVAGHLLTGGGFDCYQVLGALDWHSQYIEVLVEHGVIGAALWLALILGTVVDLTLLCARVRQRPDLEWAARYARALRAALVPYIIGGAFLGITYWDLSMQIVFCAVLLRGFATEALRHAPAARTDGPRSTGAVPRRGNRTPWDPTPARAAGTTP